MRNKNISKNNQGFTLIELLIVITIVAILATVTFVALNPTVLTGKANDTKRLSDLKNVNDALMRDIAQGNIVLKPAVTGVDSISTPSFNPYVVDGSGWVQFNTVAGSALNFKLGGLNTLPNDPKIGATATVNGATRALKYRFCTNTDGSLYEINAVLENDTASMAKDGGSDANLYEIGTDLFLCGEW